VSLRMRAAASAGDSLSSVPSAGTIRAEEPLWLTFLLCVAIVIVGLLVLIVRHRLVQFGERQWFMQWLSRFSPGIERFTRVLGYVLMRVFGVAWIAGGLFGIIVVLFGPFGEWMCEASRIHRKWSLLMLRLPAKEERNGATSGCQQSRCESRFRPSEHTRSCLGFVS
jgi:hypothetical protein